MILELRIGLKLSTPSTPAMVRILLHDLYPARYLRGTLYAFLTRDILLQGRSPSGSASVDWCRYIEADISNESNCNTLSSLLIDQLAKIVMMELRSKVSPNISQKAG